MLMQNNAMVREEKINVNEWVSTSLVMLTSCVKTVPIPWYTWHEYMYGYFNIWIFLEP